MINGWQFMATDTITIPNVQLTLDQLISAVRQLKPEVRSKVAQALPVDEMDERLAQLITRLANRPPVTDISDEASNWKAKQRALECEKVCGRVTSILSSL
jgi:hypothetical protein